MHAPRTATRTAAADGSSTQQRLAALGARRLELGQRFVHRFWLRWHMVLMLGATFGAGFLANAVMLAIPVHSMALRWLIALAFSYIAFFGCVRLWLAYVGVRPIVGDRLGDALDFTNASPSPSWNVDAGHFGGGGASGGGGQFGGGGASGDFGVGSSGGSPVDTLLSGAGDAFDVGDDGGIVLIVVGVVALAVLAAVAGSVVYLIVGAPAMLVDAAFGALLAGGLVRSVRRMDEPDWEGSVLRSSWKPFAGIALVVFAAAFALQWVAPGARTLGEVLMLIR